MKLCLGTAQLGMDYGIAGGKKPNIATAVTLLNDAYNAGIRVFDTATAYGSAEAVLGVFLRQPEINNNQIKIISKLSPGAFSNCNNENMLVLAEECIKNSLEQMGLEKIYGYMFHNAQYIFDENAIDALCSVQQKGYAEKIGVSIYTTQEAMRALESDKIDIIQIPYNIFDRRLHHCGFFERAKERGIEVYVRSVLLQGLLIMDEKDIPKYMTFALPSLREFHKLCKQFNIEPFAAAVKYVMNQSGVNYIVFGVDNTKQLNEYANLSADIPSELIDELTAKFQYVDEKVLMPNLWRE